MRSHASSRVSIVVGPHTMRPPPRREACYTQISLGRSPRHLCSVGGITMSTQRCIPFASVYRVSYVAEPHVWTLKASSIRV